MPRPDDTALFHLDAYLAHIGLPGPHTPDADTLRALNRAHLYTVPFENLDPIRGIAPSLALDDLVAKLIHGGRGGYCYEHNTLFAAALEALGFGVTRLAARVLVGADGAVRPRTHMCLLVHVPGEGDFLADVGFGAAGSLIEAVPLVADTEFRAGARRHRLVHTPHDGPLKMWVLQAYEPAEDGGAGTWADQYGFTVEPFEAPDYEVINWHIATNPRSPFSRTLYVQRVTDDTHLSLANRRLTETRADGTRTERDVTDEELPAVLAATFGITPPDDLPPVTAA
ncbi:MULTISPECIES: arylamine N-acetyltransferase [unclassified Streptomyces]|uniref:arylamine N-acetyltransferase family protein n=1 Tax=unclassified Streptomyces TaxID=2593676 RepID=UPI0033A86B1E